MIDINNNSKKLLVHQDSIPIEVDLGSPRHKDCSNFGICRINFWAPAKFNLMPSCCPNKVLGYLQRWGQSGVELIFPKENMTLATQEMHFGNGWFQVLYIYELHSELASKLGLSNFAFNPGRYLVQEIEGKLHLIFD